MQRILLIETSSRRCSVAVARDGQICAERGVLDPEGYRHAEALHPLISEVLEESGMAVRELTAIAAAQGPGSYTGLRIGLAAAKGLALPWDIPCYGISSLEVLAEAVREAVDERNELPIWAALDARRMEVYSAFFTNDGARLSEDLPEVVDESWPNRPAAWAGGDGVAKIQAHWPQLRDSGVRYAEARHLLAPLHRTVKCEPPVDPATWEPRYLKVFGSAL